MSDDSRPRHHRPIIVSGMYRSGTSLMANLVHAWGAHGAVPSRTAGDGESEPPPDEGNPRGYWQSMKVMRFMAALQRQIGVPCWHPDFRQAAAALAADPRYRDAALTLIAEMQATGRPWFWKEPMFTVLLRFWKEVWGTAVYVITIRHPYDSALSWQKYTVPAQERGRIQMGATTLLWWQTLMLSVLEDTEGAERYFIVYEQLVARPEEECRRLATFLSHATRTGEPDDARVAAMVSAVDPRLRRVRATMPFDDVEVATDAQKELYRFLLAKAADPTLPFEPRQYPFYPGWREHLDNLEILKSLYVQLHPSEAAVRSFDTAGV
jgi:hypothetical protein